MQILLSPNDLETYLKEAPIFRDCLREIREFLTRRSTPIRSDTIRKTWRGIIESKFKKVQFPFMKQKNALDEPFPFSICISADKCVAHGFGPEVLAPGISVTVDAGIATPAEREGRFLNYDSAVSCVIGETIEPNPTSYAVPLHINKSVLKVLKSIAGLHCPGLRPRDLSKRIQEEIRSYKLRIVTGLSGHCIGYKMHQLPGIPNAVFAHQGYEPFAPGTLINLEPMAVTNFHDEPEIAQTWIDSNGWSVMTSELSSHWESTFLYDGETLQDVVGITTIEGE